MKEQFTLNDAIAGIAKFVAKTMISFTGALFSAWVITVIWGWFLIPYLAMPAITYLGALSLSFLIDICIGRTLVLPYMASSLYLKNKDENLAAVLEWIVPWIYPLVLLTIGAIWHFGWFPLLIALGAT